MEIISRARWGARYARGFAPAPLPAQEVWLHHSVTAGGGVTASFDTDAAAVRLLEQIGQTRFGGGISYSFAVTESGRVFDGHGIDRRGAHTGGRNSIARAIVLVGDYSKQEPTSAQLSAVAELLGYGYRAGWWRAPRLNGGHRDAPGASTSCPGNRAHARIPAINAAAEAGGSPELKDDDLTPEETAMLRRIHHELTLFLPDRRGPEGQSLGAKDTVLGYAAHADGWGYRAAWTLADVQKRLDALTVQVAAAAEHAAPEIDYDQLAAALLRHMASG
jgi:hypothetical protein